MPEHLTPGVYFELRDQAPPIRGVRTDIAGFVGLAERGPLNRPVRVDSWRQFQAQFGDFAPYSFLAYAVKGFFENEGRTCFIVRVAGAAAARATLTLKNSAGQDVLLIVALNEGVWGNRIAVSLRTRPSAATFSLVITRDGLERESFPDLSLDRDGKRYFARVVNEGDERTAASQLITIGIAPGAPAANLLPDAEQSGLARRFGFLRGGQDGVASLTMDDFLGDAAPLAADKRGLSAFEQVDAVGVICIPDIHIQPSPPPPVAPPPVAPPRDPCLPGQAAPPALAAPGLAGSEQPPIFSADEVFEVQRAMIEHCERLKDRVAILDAPAPAGGRRPLGIAEIQQWRRGLDSERGFGALYHPWIKVVDPLRLGGDPLRAIPPCGHVAGLYARSDLSVGVHKAPANAELWWAEDVTAEINDEAQAVLNPVGINCLRAFPGRGIRVYGARTLSSNPDWRYVNVRRLMLMIEEAVDEATQWAVFEPHNANLRQTLVFCVSGFLEAVWRQGGLAGDTPQQAFYVKCDETTNPPAVVNLGRLIAEIGVAPTRPAEFIVFRIGRTTGEFEVVER